MPILCRTPPRLFLLPLPLPLFPLRLSALSFFQLQGEASQVALGDRHAKTTEKKPTTEIETRRGHPSVHLVRERDEKGHTDIHTQGGGRGVCEMEGEKEKEQTGRGVHPFSIGGGVCGARAFFLPPFLGLFRLNTRKGREAGGKRAGAHTCMREERDGRKIFERAWHFKKTKTTVGRRGHVFG